MKEQLSDIAGEESEEPCVDTVDDGCEVSRVVEEVDFVDVDHHHLALVLLEDELLVALIEIGEILYLDGFFIFPAPLFFLQYTKAQVRIQAGAALLSAYSYRR